MSLRKRIIYKKKTAKFWFLRVLIQAKSKNAKNQPKKKTFGIIIVENLRNSFVNIDSQMDIKIAFIPSHE